MFYQRPWYKKTPEEICSCANCNSSIFTGHEFARFDDLSFCDLSCLISYAVGEAMEEEVSGVGCEECLDEIEGTAISFDGCLFCCEDCMMAYVSKFAKEHIVEEYF